MSLLLALLLGLAPQDVVFEQVQILMGERRFGEAWELCPRIEDPVLSARAEADLAYYARDFPLSLAAAGRGLETDPQDLFLLHRALSAALWIRDGERAETLADRLAQAIPMAEVDTDAREWWQNSAQLLATQAHDLRAGADERAARLARARLIAVAVLVVSAGAFALFLRRDQG